MAEPGPRLDPIVRFAPAKINLTLAVTGRRPDGYHALHSVMAPLGLADRISLGVASDGRDTLDVEGFDAGPAAANLVLRAIEETRAAVGRGPDLAPTPAGRRTLPLIAVRLEKRIPVAAGLGGGSSDAAATIDGALAFWGAALGDEDRLAVALGLGSDVPFFLAGGPALVEGRGERVTPLPPIRGEPPGVLLVTPAVAVSTAAVFAAYAAGIRGAGGGAARLASEHLATELRAGLDARALVLRAGVLASANDLLAAAAAVTPGLLDFRRRLGRRLGRPVGQSGSGPTCWVLYPSPAAAEEGAALVEAAVRDGALPAPGDGSPFVAATTFGGPARDPSGRIVHEHGGGV